MKKILISILLLSAVAFGGYTIFKESLDRYNPFIIQEHVYVQIKGSPEDNDGRFKYQIEGYNADGKTKKVTFTTSTVLAEGTYVKVSAKGAYTEGFEIIEEEDLPNGVSNLL
ncbi:YxeA family protein [Sutcliffiella rhizosphaerae]|uniref:YxeA family protein n=1 Tax=Sutcliffiella rhizosphaerae TaxID=2880967 RepID=A0ABN8AEF9_9BACI|nr:YxeA family protein [Sutcliffiella rhizosphaerae]CAG9623670.1 hypothetical protein BACCIP111883_04502 [Sutcliffiella rhizosphaerae]